MQPEHSPSDRRRAAWALALLVPAPTLGTLAAFVVWPGPVGQVLYALAKIWIAALPLVWRLRVDRQRLSLSPLGRSRILPGLAVGILLGLAMGLAVPACLAFGREAFGRDWMDVERLNEIRRAFGLTRFERYVAFSAYIVFVNSLLEEYVWRWFVFEKWKALLSPRGGSPQGPANSIGPVLLSAACFTLHHAVAFAVFMDLPLAALASLGVFLGSALWSACYRAFCSIWPGYLSHALVDFVVLWFGIGMFVD